MSQSWHCLYIPQATTEDVAGALRTTLAAHGFAPYDPFPGGSGTPPGLQQMARLFVAPPQDGWVRVLGELDASLLTALSEMRGGDLLAAWLTEEDGGFARYAGGERNETPEAFAAYFRPEIPQEARQQAFAGDLPVEPLETNSPDAGTLPPELAQLAREHGVDTGKAGSMFERLSGNLFGRLSGQDSDSGSEQAQARAIFMGGGRDLWNSRQGQRVRAIASVLALPANWRMPDWDAVRDAYHALRMRQRYPRMIMLPGDKESLAAVPDIEAYTPIYMGRR